MNPMGSRHNIDVYALAKILGDEDHRKMAGTSSAKVWRDRLLDA
jgi:hypothetical protein